MKSPIILFYLEGKPDNRGRTISEILRWGDQELEDVHDYIQWLFPAAERSQFNRDAPLLTAADIKEFQRSKPLQDKLRLSFERLLTFYGLTFVPGKPGCAVKRGPGFIKKSEEWLTPYNHNFLRITRILKCLSLLGLKQEAIAFFQELSRIYETHHRIITEETFEYWQDAVK